MKHQGRLTLKLLKRFHHFINYTIWKPAHSKGVFNRWFFQSMRVLTVSFRSYATNHNSMRASALTFYATLSIVPVFAVAFGIAQGFGFEERLESQVRTTFAGQEEVVSKILEFSQSTLSNVSGGLVAGISILFLLWSVIKLLNHIETAFNVIWNLEKSRPFLRKFTDYLTLMLVGPIFIFISSSLTLYINTSVSQLSNGGQLVAMTSTVLLSLMQFAPFVSTWVLFTFLYLVIPNISVKFTSAVAGGVLAGTAFAFLQNGYVYFQLAMSRYNAIYGSFAALPLFLIWLQISWLIILFGAEITRAVQQSSLLLSGYANKKLSPRLELLISLHLLTEIAQAFTQRKAAPHINQLAETLHYPVSLVEQNVQRLLQAKLIAPIAGTPTTYLPAMEVGQMRFVDMALTLNRYGFNELSGHQRGFDELDKQLQALEKLWTGSSFNQALIRSH
ncbi:MAG: YihY/virulence factor BrkB family protein [Bacteroidetes bacterium]|nr:YihY/virulence factor BrkB family protein [Bacteroidota bacterium]